RASCVFDGATTAGDYVQISSTTGGDCHDAGSAYPSVGQVLGRVLSTNGAGGTYAIEVFGPEINPANAVTASSSPTFTNKTIDAEGTGNTITIPIVMYIPAAGCNNATASANFDLPTSNAPTASCLTGTNQQQGTLDFGDSANSTAQTEFILPDDWTGNID